MSYTDLLTRLKNAQGARKESVKLPFSALNFSIAGILEKHGYVAEVAKKGRMPKRVIEIKLKYEDGQGVISGVRFISKPARHLYTGYRDLKPVKQNYGLGVISTPKGVMTTGEAKKQKLGGELLFEIW